jgi:hypothetical protein
MKFKKRMTVGLLSGLMLGATTANAQFAQPMYGTGVAGANQPCPYPMRVADGATSKLDTYNEVQRNLEKETKNLVKITRDKRRLERTISDAKDVINGTVATKYAEFILEHIDGQNRCSDYKGYGANDEEPGTAEPAPAPAPAPAPQPPPPDVAAPPAAPGESAGETDKERAARLKREREQKQGKAPNAKGDKASNDRSTEAPSRIPASVVEGFFVENAPMSRGPASVEEDGAQSGLLIIRGFTPAQWTDVCMPGKNGGVRPTVCSRPPYSSLRKRNGSEEDCRKALNTLINLTKDYQALESKELTSKRNVERLEEDLAYEKDLPSDMRTSSREGTEGKICYECLRAEQEARQRAQYASLAVAGVGAVDMFIDYKKAKQIAEYNSQLGWATQPYPGSGVGPTLIAQGLAGYINGGIGSGSFGCASGVNGTGPVIYPQFGGGNSALAYPPGTYAPPQAGAMYNPGAGPWGPNGPFALNGNQGNFFNGNGNGNGVPIGAIIGMDSFGNPIYNRGGGVPSQFMPLGTQFGVPGQNGVMFGNPGQMGTNYIPGYNAPGMPGQNGFGNNTPGFYQVPGGYNNGSLGVNPGALQSGLALQTTNAGLFAEQAALNNRIGAINNAWSMGGNNSMSQYGWSNGVISGFNQYGAPIYNTGGSISGSLTIGGSYSGGQQNYLGTSSGGPIITPATRRMGK